MEDQNASIAPISEKGKEIYDHQARFLSGLALVENKVMWKGIKNKIEVGPNIIVSNHPGAHKDIAVLIALYRRQLFFSANSALYKPETFEPLVKDYTKKWVLKILGALGTAAGDNVNFFLSPFRKKLVKYVSSNISEVGSISVDVSGGHNQKALSVMEQYIADARPVVVMQYDHKFSRSKYAPNNKDIYAFRFGAPKLAYNVLVNHGLDAPVTPISIKGTKGLFSPFGKVLVNFGEPMHISEYMQEKEPIVAFRDALEKRVVELYDDFK